MTLTKRDLVIRISEETGLTQTQVFDVISENTGSDCRIIRLVAAPKCELRNSRVCI